eukprot:scaffold153536_cov18-Tisochrysis_lutea.AAC.1
MNREDFLLTAVLGEVRPAGAHPASGPVLAGLQMGPAKMPRAATPGFGERVTLNFHIENESIGRWSWPQ